MVTRDKKVLNYFSQLRRQDALGSAYLFIGDNQGVVYEVIKQISCKEDDLFCGTCWDCQRIEAASHPDLLVIEPQPLTIKIEQIKEAQKTLYLKSFRLSRKVLLIKQGEKLGTEAANAFLKTLEEPPPHTFIALCASKLDTLLPTIISRCRKIFLPISDEELSPSYEASVNSFFRGEYVAFKTRRDFAQFLEGLIYIFRDKLISSRGVRNNRLLGKDNYEIILARYAPQKLEEMLEAVIALYNTYTTVNQNLALHMIRSLM